MSEPNAPQPPLTELQQIDARVLEAERRVIPVVRNFLKMRRTLPPEDPRREATRSALLWCILSPSNAVGAAGVGSLVVAFMTIALAREGNEFVREELVHIKAQNELSRQQFTATQEQFAAQQEQFVAQRRAEAIRRRGELLVRLFERRDCKTEEDPQDCPYAADSQSRVYAFVELAGVQAELERLEKAPLLGMNSIDLSGIRFPVDLTLNHLIAAEIDLSYAHLRDLKISDAKFIGGNLQRAEFNHVIVRDTSFERADLRGAKFNASSFTNVDFSDANLIDANLIDAQFVDCKFKGADLTWAQLGHDPALMASTHDVRRCPDGEQHYTANCKEQLRGDPAQDRVIASDFYNRVEAHLMGEPGGGFAGETVQVTISVDPRAVQGLRVMTGSLSRAQLQGLQRIIAQYADRSQRGRILTMEIQASAGMVSINDPGFFAGSCTNGQRGGIISSACAARGTDCHVELAPPDAQVSCTWERSATEEVVSFSDSCVATIVSLGPKSLLRSLDFRAGDLVRSDESNTCPRIRHHQLWSQLWRDGGLERIAQVEVTVFVTRAGNSFKKRIQIHGDTLRPK